MYASDEVLARPLPRPLTIAIGGQRQFPLVSAGVGACSDPVADAEKRLKIVDGSGSAAQICEQSKFVAAAHLNAKNSTGYELANVKAGLACNRVLLHRLDKSSDASVLADEMEASAERLEP